MKVNLPDNCPICGAGYHFGSDKMKIAFVDKNGIKHYSLPIRHYHCGSKIWVSEERETGYTLILRKCVESREDELTCDDCRKCGETICGNDSINLSCFEPKEK